MTRRRRRILIVSSVLVLLIGGLWWWSRPNLDSRFVGTWAVFQTKDQNPDGLNVDKAGQVIRLNADGLIANEFEPEDLIHWQIDSHGRLAFVESLPALDRLKKLANYVFAKLTGGRVWSFDTRFAVITVEPNRIVLQGDVATEPFIILKRVPPADPVR